MSYLTIPQLCQMFECSEGTLRNWIKQDLLPYDIIGGQYMFDRLEVKKATKRWPQRPPRKEDRDACI